MNEMKTCTIARAAVRATKAPSAAQALGLLWVLLAGCHTTATYEAPLSESVVRLGLPPVRQDALYDSGLSSLSALCQYWGIEIPAEKRASLVLSAADDAGLLGSEVLEALQQLGLEVEQFEGSLDRTATGIYGHVDAGRPPLVMLSNDASIHHFALVLGYDEQRSNLILLDPRAGEILVPISEFEHTWARCKRFTLLAFPSEATRVAVSQQGDVDSGPPYALNLLR